MDNEQSSTPVPVVRASSDSTDSQPSDSSPSSRSAPWWHDPTRLLAVAGAIALRWAGRLGETETAMVLAVALGAPITQGAMRALRRLRAGKP